MAYYYSGTNCFNSSDTLIFVSDSPISLPIVVSRAEKPGCFTLTNQVGVSPNLQTFTNTFTTCQDCMKSLAPCPVRFKDCNTGESYFVLYRDIFPLPFVPQVGQVYLMTIKDREGKYIQSCFTPIEYVYNPGNEKECRIPLQLWELISISPSSFGSGDVGCALCQAAAPTYWRVKECISGNEYIVSLPPGTDYKFYAITFTIDTLGIDLYCGVIIDGTNFLLPTAFVSSIIGYVGEGSGTNPEEFCNSCVASGATKVLIQNCLDGSQEVIWSSNLFNPGDVSNISLGGGQCYEILSATTGDVTINELLNYEPSPTCTDCLNCEQVQFTYTIVKDNCFTDVPICPYINSYQYVPFGTVIGYGNRCIQITDVQPSSGGTINCGDAIIQQQLVSFPVYVDCFDCINNPRTIWLGTDCVTNHWDYIVFTGLTSFVPGQIVQVQRNGSDYTCYTLQVQTGGEQPPLPNIPDYYYSLTEVPFNTCGECQSGSTIGITIIDCDYASASYITVSLYDYLRLTGNDGSPATPVLQYNGKCHLILNDCPIDNIYPLVTSTLYNNCIECSADLNITRYSGTTCFSQEPINVIYNETNILTPGTIVLTNNGTCVTISGETNETNTEGTITTTGLTSCYDCYLGESTLYAVAFQQCLTNEVYFILLSQIGFLPTLGEVYFLDFLDGNDILHQTCFTVVGLEILQGAPPTNLNSISVPYVDCTDCYTNNLIRYIVDGCDGNTYVVGYPSSGLEGMVTFTPIGEVDQYCGTIVGITESLPISATLNTILGKSVKCEECLSGVAKKRILTNCLNGNQEVVWGSLLFAEGNITHIQTGEGCYEVGPETELEVTLNEFLDFDNYPTCQECIQCNGVHYFWSACTPEFGVTSASVDANVGFYTTFIAYKSSTNQIFVADSNNRIALYDASTFVNLNNYYGPAQIQQFFFLHPTNNLIYFVNGGNLWTFSTTSGTFNLVFPIPSGYVIISYFYDPITNNLWLTVYNSYVYVFNLTTNTLVATIGLPYPFPAGITYNPNNDKVYVEDSSYPYLYVIDRTSYTYSIYTVGVYYSQNIIYDNTTNRIFGRNHYIDCSTLNVTSIGFDFNAGIIQDPISGNLLAWDFGGTQLKILNPSTLITSYNNTFLPYSPINFALYGLTYNSNTNEYYVAAAYYNSIVTLTLGDIYKLGEIDSNQYAPLNSYFYHPKYGCSLIYDILPSSGATAHAFYSFENFTTCEECTSNQYDVWEAYDCITGKFAYVVTQAGLYSQGDVVNVKWGETDFVCHRLEYLLQPSQYQNINENKDFFIADGTSFGNYEDGVCVNCSDGTNISISIIDCGNQNSMFVNVSLSVWFILTGYGGVIPRPVFLFGDTCYRVLNECPFNPDHYPINPSYIYYNCEACNNPLEANPETVLCIQNCSGGTYTMMVNHPYWTNQFGKTIIQNNAVGLGGQSGYNS